MSIIVFSKGALLLECAFVIQPTQSTRDQYARQYDHPYGISVCRKALNKAFRRLLNIHMPFDLKRAR